MVLVGRSVPVVGVAHPQFWVGVIAEVDQLVEQLVEQRHPAPPRQPPTPTLEPLSRHPRRSPPHPLIEPLLPPAVAAIQPHRQPTAGTYHPCHLVEDLASVLVVMHHADRKHQVKRTRLQGQSLQIRLQEAHARQIPTHLRRLVHRRTVIGPDHFGTRQCRQPAVATAPTPRIQHPQPRQFLEPHTRLHLQNPTILLVTHHLEPVPLRPEPLEMSLLDKPRNPTLLHPQSTASIARPPARLEPQPSMALGTDQQVAGKMFGRIRHRLRLVRQEIGSYVYYRLRRHPLDGGNGIGSTLD